MAYLAPALAKLRGEVNAAHPNRDKSSDGWIGDVAHQGRVSDHNPDPVPNGVVRALDLDKDGMNKADIRRVVTGDGRTEYFIQDGLIYTRSNGFKAQTYTGANKHTEHSHTSIRHGAQWENDTRPWGYNATPATPPAPTASNIIAQLAVEVIRGEWGNGDERKRRLTNAGWDANAVQAEVNRRMAHVTPPPTLLSLHDIAQQVIRGNWGNGADRRQRLTLAGYNATQVQNEVNRQLS